MTDTWKIYNSWPSRVLWRFGCSTWSKRPPIFRNPPFSMALHRFTFCQGAFYICIHSTCWHLSSITLRGMSRLRQLLHAASCYSVANVQPLPNDRPPMSQDVQYIRNCTFSWRLSDYFTIWTGKRVPLDMMSIYIIFDSGSPGNISIQDLRTVEEVSRQGGRRPRLWICLW